MLTLCGICAGCGTGSDPPTSVILIVIDTLRSDHLSLYGYAKPTSPGLERLARESVVFERCLAPSPWTQPSTVSLLSGLYPTRHGVQDHEKVSEEIEFIGERLQAAGFSTAGISGNPNASPIFRMDQGFDHFEFSRNRVARNYPDIGKLLEEASTWIDERPRDPFFLYLHVMNVHGPYRAPPEYRQRFLEEPHSAFPFQGEIWNDIVVRHDLGRRAEVTPAHLRDLRARYDGAIAYSDDQLAAFIEALRSRGLLSHSLLIVTSDHGEELFDHGGFGHGLSLHRELLEVPLLIRLPGGVGGGRRISQPVSLVDLPATILDLLGLLDAESAGRFGDGISLVPALRPGLAEAGASPADAESRALLARLEAESWGRASMIQDWPYRMMEIQSDYQGRKNVVSLFNVEIDPGERVDLAAADPDRVKALRSRAKQLRRELLRDSYQNAPAALSEEERRGLEALGYGN